MRQPTLNVSIHLKHNTRGREALLETLSQQHQVAISLYHFLGCQLGRMSKTNNAGNIQGAGTSATFMASTETPGMQLDPGATTTRIQSSDAFRPVELMEDTDSSDIPGLSH